MPASTLLQAEGFVVVSMYHQSPVWLAMLRVAPVFPMLEMLSAGASQPAARVVKVSDIQLLFAAGQSSRCAR